ncbi:MAG: bacteriophage T4 gp5 trimerization domain-containing protein, partial [Marinobacter sp.]|uniref:bacteriophage T4 gp5 trimerisation domain-containing protein n=1 Tax=Marinobacter sp. TaxID=50741 RepID=UPI003C684739
LDLLTENNRTEVIRNDSHLTVDNNRFAQIKGSDHSTVDGERRDHIGGDYSLTANGSHHSKQGKNQLIEAGSEIHHKAGMKIVIEAGAEVTLKAGGSFVKVDPSGVTVSGPLVRMNSGGGPGSGSGASAQVPEVPTILDEAQIPERSSTQLEGTEARNGGPSDQVAPSALQAVGVSAITRAAKGGQTFVSGCEFDNSGRCVIHDHG